jgi:hypothetical protein
MDACICVCTVEKSSIRHSSHPIPSIEFSPTNSPLDEGNLFIHSNPLEKVHIVYISVAKLSLVERLILPHLLGAMDGNVIVICGHRNAIVCKIADQPPPPRSRAVMARRKNTALSFVTCCHWSVSQSLGWMGQTRALAVSSSCTTLATTHKEKYLSP